MNEARTFRIVLVTCGSRAEARKLARVLVAKRLAACVNIVAGVESVYRWKARVRSDREWLLLIKSSKRRLAELERTVRRLHSYQTPEFLVLGVAAGSKSYLDWWATSLGEGKRKRG